ncbi:hypothetical protein MADA3029_860012 [Vibrio nigripulchritudo MADA3029]|uniref:hypothetical protein n=1 Tax=Vibrio nigripulchritudo TaxID=28173 RepID=UPI0003B1D2A2|nr:hypothetical protein [Vibrio nigripulchritudo]CCN48829.1 hypothetical protein VIBNIMADA3020_620011 [Vibrio nigripulchritudo MADA3020]CCN55355.1 hypothetical protein VIBNIMADA3021_750013 [Vibrio nigripulchritudo MADA3021]CCN61760.1 hypothetical protein MADA3029_860012 [Vibrio nigripulchritudo MADA3029]
MTDKVIDEIHASLQALNRAAELATGQELIEIREQQQALFQRLDRWMFERTGKVSDDVDSAIALLKDQQQVAAQAEEGLSDHVKLLVISKKVVEAIDKILDVVS